MLKWIFFDLDGVLVNSRHLHTNAFKEALIIEGIKLSEEEHSALDGLPTKIKLQRLLEKHSLSPDKVVRIQNKKQEVTIELLQRHIKPSGELKNLLNYLKGEKIKLAVCTNAVRETLDLSLSLLGIQDLFEFTLSNDDVSLPKPSPEIYLLALQKSESLKHETLIVEDSVHGIKAAEDSGCIVLKVQSAEDVTLDKFKMLMLGAS